MLSEFVVTAVKTESAKENATLPDGCYRAGCDSFKSQQCRM